MAGAGNRTDGTVGMTDDDGMIDEAGATSETSGIVLDIQRAALHDGQGLRATVFLKGCPLRCAWCHNPESQAAYPETGASGKIYGASMSVAAVMVVVERDRGYYDASGGGVTLSGGEPTQQFGFCRELLRAARRAGIHTCLDTCGELPTSRLIELVPLVDLFLFDIKLADAEGHRRWTGVDGTLIRRNLDELLRRGAAVHLRAPIVPGVNDDPVHDRFLRDLEATGQFVAVERMPYHDIGRSKYEDLGRQPPAFDGFLRPGVD